MQQQVEQAEQRNGEIEREPRRRAHEPERGRADPGDHARSQVGEAGPEVDSAQPQLAQAAEQRIPDHAGGDFLRLAHDEPGERDAGHDDEEQRERDHETGRELGTDPRAQPHVERREDGVQDGNPEEARGVRRERDDQGDAQQQHQQRGALVIRVDQGHALV